MVRFLVLHDTQEDLAAWVHSVVYEVSGT